jgi:hypothetical protein
LACHIHDWPAFRNFVAANWGAGKTYLGALGQLILMGSKKEDAGDD